MSEQSSPSGDDPSTTSTKGSIAPSLPAPRISLGLVPEEVQLLEQTPEYAISTWRSVMFLAWRGPETTSGIVRSRILMAPWAERRQGGVVLVILMPPKSALSRPPSDEARAAMADVSRNASAIVKGIGIIGDVGGFISAVVRSVMIARQALVKSAIPFKMFSSSEEAAPWVTQRLGMQDGLRREFVSSVEKAHWK